MRLLRVLKLIFWQIILHSFPPSLLGRDRHGGVPQEHAQRKPEAVRTQTDHAKVQRARRARRSVSEWKIKPSKTMGYSTEIEVFVYVEWESNII